MATVYVTEFPSASSGNGMPVPACPPIAKQIVAITTATLSAAFSPNTRLIRVHADAICSVEVGGQVTGAATVTTASQRMAAGQTEYFGVTPGDKLSVITNS